MNGTNIGDVVRVFSFFPCRMEIGEVSLELYADGTFKGDVKELEAELGRVEGIGYPDGLGAILWLVLREMKRDNV